MGLPIFTFRQEAEIRVIIEEIFLEHGIEVSHRAFSVFVVGQWQQNSSAVRDSCENHRMAGDVAH
jgi:hypothetical protein